MIGEKPTACSGSSLASSSLSGRGRAATSEQFPDESETALEQTATGESTRDAENPRRPSTCRGIGAYEPPDDACQPFDDLLACWHQPVSDDLCQRFKRRLQDAELRVEFVRTLRHVIRTDARRAVHLLAERQILLHLRQTLFEHRERLLADAEQPGDLRALKVGHGMEFREQLDKHLRVVCLPWIDPHAAEDPIEAGIRATCSGKTFDGPARLFCADPDLFGGEAEFLQFGRACPGAASREVQILHLLRNDLEPRAHDSRRRDGGLRHLDGILRRRPHRFLKVAVLRLVDLEADLDEKFLENAGVSCHHESFFASASLMRRSFSSVTSSASFIRAMSKRSTVPLIRDSYLHKPLRTGRMSQSSPDAIATGSNVTPLRDWIRVGL